MLVIVFRDEIYVVKDGILGACELLSDGWELPVSIIPQEDGFFLIKKQERKMKDFIKITLVRETGWGEDGRPNKYDYEKSVIRTDEIFSIHEHHVKENEYIKSFMWLKDFDKDKKDSRGASWRLLESIDEIYDMMIG